MDGYHRLSQLMGSTPAVAIVRRYGTLNIQNILYMQAEISELETELQQIAVEDRFSGDPEKERFSREWWRLAGAQGGDSLQWNKWLEVRTKLDEYSTKFLCDETNGRLMSSYRFRVVKGKGCAQHARPFGTRHQISPNLAFTTTIRR